MQYALESLGYVDKHILWVGLSRKRNGPAHIYDYDMETHDLRELEEKRKDHGENYPCKLHPLGDSFCYTGDHGKLMSLNLIVE